MKIFLIVAGCLVGVPLLLYVAYMAFLWLYVSKRNPF